MLPLREPVDASLFASLPEEGRQARLPVRLKHNPNAVLALSAARLTPPGAGAPQLALTLRDISDEEALHRLLGDFLANIAHEFRTPLSALAASIEILLDQIDVLSPEETRQLLNALHLGTLGLQTLIDNLLEGASIESGKFRVSPRTCTLPEIIADVTTSLQALFEKYEQRITLEIPPNLPAIHADPHRTSQSLVNYLSNAIKWNPAHGSIAIPRNARRKRPAPDGRR